LLDEDEFLLRELSDLQLRRTGQIVIAADGHDRVFTQQDPHLDVGTGNIRPDEGRIESASFEQCDQLRRRAMA